MERLVGMFGIGEKPTGSKDPHGMRSVAFIIMRILRSRETKLEGDKLLQTARDAFDELPHFDLHEIWNFIIARIIIFVTADSEEKMARQAQISRELQKAIMAQGNFSVADIYSRFCAAGDFSELPEAEILIAAGKRINNIFRKSGVESVSFSAPDDSLFEHEAERLLHLVVEDLTWQTKEKTNKGEYVEALRTLAHVANPMDDFFEKVMVNAEDKKVRDNRFALLHELRTLLNCVAKLS